MWPYWFLFTFAVTLSLTHMRPATSLRDRGTALWFSAFLFLALMIGLRHEVGGDWLNYLRHFNGLSSSFALEDVFAKGDPAYEFLNWLFVNTDGGAYWVNVVCAVFFSWGLVVFCRDQPNPWLALVVAIPYMVIVVAMGYTRQGVAIGLAMLGLTALANGNTVRFVLWVGLAAAFHKSAVILVPLAVLGSSKHRIMTLLWVAAVAILLFVLLLQESVENLVVNYIDAQYESSGAAIRVAMNALPALLFLRYRKRFGLPAAQRSFWTWMALGAVGFVVLLKLSPSSTAVDRIALYWIPLQVFVYSRLPAALGRQDGKNTLWVLAIIAYCAAVQFVWLFFGHYSWAWLPYQFYPFTLLGL